MKCGVKNNRGVNPRLLLIDSRIGFPSDLLAHLSCQMLPGFALVQISFPILFLWMDTKVITTDTAVLTLPHSLSPLFH